MTKITTKPATTTQQTKTAHQLVLEAVLGLPQMKGKTLIHLSIVGSRSKQLASEDSDYDVKAVILHSTNDYLLQKVTTSKSFTTDIVDPNTRQTVEVEGTLVDYLTMTNYILSSNQAAYDAIYGIPLHETPESDYLKQLFGKTYNPHVELSSFQGLLISEQKKAHKNGLDRNIKYVTNMIYYAIAVHALAGSGEPLGSDAFALLEKLSADSELKQRIHELFQQRKSDKSRMVETVEPFQELFETANRLQVPNRKISSSLQRDLQEESDAFFLALVARSS